MRFALKEYNKDIEVIHVMLYVSLRARRNFPTSCQFYKALCFKYLEIFTDKILLVSS